MGRRSGREVVVPVSGDVLDPPMGGGKSGVEFVARPVASPVAYGPQEVRIVVEQAAAPGAPVEVPRPSRAVPWALIAVALCIMLYACFAAWHTMQEPKLQPIRHQGVDLVAPSRGEGR